MFEKKTKRYLTKEVNEQVPVLIQGLCWKLIDRQVAQCLVKVDYLQIFEFQRDIDRNVIVIIHRQEERTSKRGLR